MTAPCRERRPMAKTIAQTIVAAAFFVAWFFAEYALHR